jgi:prevent-host-death family protein
MEATALDLRTKTREVLRRVEAGETVVISRRGKPAALLSPLPKTDHRRKLEAPVDLPAFGMWSDRTDLLDPSEHVRELRRSRF